MTLLSTKYGRAASAEKAARWAAIVRRDRAADGRFVYGVTSTHVYCRPSCPARRARREHVRFYDSGEAAERAGFRPCKRCRPADASVAQRRAAAVAAACRLIERGEEMPRLGSLAKAVGMSPFHFHRVFKALTGVTPVAYRAEHRARRVRDALHRSATVTEAIYASGFNSNGRFYAAAGDVLGMTPTMYRAGGRGAVIRFAVDKTSLGRVLVAATDTGVCAILLGDDRAELVHNLRARFPNAELVGGDRTFDRTVARVIQLVEAPQLAVDLPLDVRGTAFQRRVWEALRTIPVGSTASYAAIARRIGAPRAVRAVARACAANAIAVAIPCHRIVRADGGLAGYRWGIERKRTLLQREGAR
jgi:AraC family transcriptional regulator of adaptative response/methylated-DNA-[protein]-cysteine methyltransferase